MIQREKRMLLREFKSLTTKLKEMKENDQNASNKGHTERRRPSYVPEPNQEFCEEVLGKIEMLDSKYKTLHKNMLGLQKTGDSEETTRGSKKSRSESACTKDREKGKKIVELKSIEHNIDSLKKQISVNEEILKEKQKVLDQVEARRQSVNNIEGRHTKREQEQDQSSRETEEEASREKVSREKLEKTLKPQSLLTKREDELKKREETLELRIREFEQKQEMFENYKKQTEERLRREDIEIKERRRGIEKLEDDILSKRKALERNEVDFERLTRKLEEESENLIRDKQEFEENIEAFNERWQKFEEQKQEFANFEQNFHQRNQEMNAERERFREASDELSLEREELERRYEDYYKEYADLESQRQLIDRIEEEMTTRERMLSGKVRKTQNEDGLSRRRDDLKRVVEMAETRVRAQDEILTRRERLTDRSATNKENDENFDTESFEYRHKVGVRSSGKKLRGDSFKEKFQEHFKKGRVDIPDDLRSSNKKTSKGWQW